MPREFKRSDRVADAILRSAATVLRQEIRDPRIGMVNISEVNVTRDLSQAKLYVTFIGEDDEGKIEEGMEALNDAAGFIRSVVAKDLNMRTMPRLVFIFDKVSITGHKLSNLIDKAIDSDRAKSHDENPDGDK